LKKKFLFFVDNKFSKKIKYFTLDPKIELYLKEHKYKYSESFSDFYRKKVEAKFDIKNVLINQKINRYTKEIRNNIVSYQKNLGQTKRLKNFNFYCLFSVWLYRNIQIIIFLTDLLLFLKKKKISFQLDKNHFFIFQDSYNQIISLYKRNYLFFILKFFNSNNNIRLSNPKLIFSKKNSFFVKLLFYLKSFFKKKTILLSLDGLNLKKKIAYFFLSFFNKIIINLFSYYYIDPSKYVDLKFRKKIKIKEKDLYDKNFNKILPYIIPLNFLENFKNIFENLTYQKKYFCKIFSSTSFYFNDYYNFLLSFGKIKCFELQHGSSYCLLKKKRLIKKITKKKRVKFIGYTDKKINILGLKFYQLKKDKIINNKIISLFTFPKDVRPFGNVYVSPTIDIINNETLQNDFIFYNTLESNLKKNFVIRFLNKESTYYFSKWENLLLNNQINCTLGGNKRLIYLSKVLVTHTFSTAMYEALYIGIPIVGYIKFNRSNLKKELLNIIDSLKEANVFFDNPESAAKFLNKSYSNLLDWWFNYKVAKNIKNLKNYLFNEKKYSDLSFIKALKSY